MQPPTDPPGDAPSPGDESDDQTLGCSDQTAQARLETAALRDEVADARDLAAHTRDLAAEARDRAIAGRDASHEDAAEQRELAAQDRRAAAADREQAVRDRLQALADREALARQLAITETDALTGARTRAAGLADLDHEIERCRRSNGQLVAAYVDLVGLKGVNDSEGHTAGDRLLRNTVAVIREHLRPYDLVIRVGGDEFVCVMSTITEEDARRRFGEISAALATAPSPCRIRTGFGQLRPGESSMELIARADRELVDGRAPE